MDINKRRLIFYFFWFIIILASPFTVFINSPFVIAFSDAKIIVNVLQRISGLLAFTLIMLQIIIGSNLSLWTKILGAKAYRIHIVQGLFAYGLILFHPLTNSVLIYFATQSIVNVLVDLLPRFRSSTDSLILFGKTAFVLASISVFASYFRTKPFLRKNWRVFHILNYLVFILIIFHSKGLESDIATFPFNIVYFLGIAAVSLSIARRIYLSFLKELLFSNQPA